ncbi:MAG: hypothetical protein RIQ54_340, partial [Candidatus Parcubacteria bacterium]
KAADSVEQSMGQALTKTNGATEISGNGLDNSDASSAPSVSDIPRKTLF